MMVTGRHAASVPGSPPRRDDRGREDRADGEPGRCRRAANQRIPVAFFRAGDRRSSPKRAASGWNDATPIPLISAPIHISGSVGMKPTSATPPPASINRPRSATASNGDRRRTRSPVAGRTTRSPAPAPGSPRPGVVEPAPDDQVGQQRGDEALVEVVGDVRVASTAMERHGRDGTQPCYPLRLAASEHPTFVGS